VVALRKVRPTVQPTPARPLRILVACESVALTGGLLRFDRFARTVAPWGHEVALMPFAGVGASQRPTDLRVLSWEEASKATWDAVMVPGAGFSEATIARFNELRAPNFGLRVQHILNDRSKQPGFQSVNDAFQPDVVVFNNSAWPVGTFTKFKGKRFHVLEGAV